MPADHFRERLTWWLRTMYYGCACLMKRAKCFFCCVNWRNVILYLLLTILIVVLLCLLPRWVLCFLVLALALGCGALVIMRR